MRIQIWSPGLDASWIAEDLKRAHLSVLSVPECTGIQPDVPLLLGYADPLVRVQAPELPAPGSDGSEVLAALPELVAAGQRCRLLNLSCVQVPALVAWCVDPSSPPPLASQPRFVEADPLDALLAIALLEEHPEQLEIYRSLETHPLAAALDQRPPDLHCLDRYRRASRWDALFQLRQQLRLLESDFMELASQLEPLRHQQGEAFALGEQLALVKTELKQVDALQLRSSELQLTVLAQQQDLEHLARRLALLEQLVATGSDASLRVQARMAQVLA